MNQILNLIGRKKELFTKDINSYNEELKNIISTSRFLVIGGIGLIGQKFIKAINEINKNRSNK